MLRNRPTWIRGLALFDADEDAWLTRLAFGEPTGEDGGVHARSRFRSRTHPRRFALYYLHDAGWPRRAWLPGVMPGDHTLMVVREFRRVPLEASGLALMLFRARPGKAASLVAALAHFVERAVSSYQPAYLLLAQSFEQPLVTVLLTGVRECAALQAARASAFSVDGVLPEVDPMLMTEPEVYAYCPDRNPEDVPMLVSPRAV